MFITRAELQRRLAEAWDRGHSAGVDFGDEVAAWTLDGTLGYTRSPEPVPTSNPYR